MGIIKRKITGIPPIKFPINISGLCSATAVNPTANSGVDVKSPRIIKETAKDESPSFLENLSTEDTTSPAPSHMKIKEAIYKSKFAISTIYSIEN